MHIFFSGVGGTGIGPLALIAHRAGYQISGSDKQESSYVNYLRTHGVDTITIGQSYEQITAVHTRAPIDWYVFSSAITKEQGDDAPELRFCREHGIRTSKRDEFLSALLTDKHLKLIAIAGTHGKTTTTALTIWAFKQLGIPLSYSVGAKLSFGEMGAFDPASEFFVYEADEYDRNFLAFHPYFSIITGIDWDHPDTFPTRQDYVDAFKRFVGQSQGTLLWEEDLKQLRVAADEHHLVLHKSDSQINQVLHLPGVVNRQNAWQVAHALQQITGKPLDELLVHLNRFPGVARRFEQIAPRIYSDYAHTPAKIRGALQLAREVAGDNVVVVYEGLHNTRQHFIKDELATLFDHVKALYIVPSYLAREDPNLSLLSPADLVNLLSPTSKAHAYAAALDDHLAETIRQTADNGDTVLCITAGGGNSLDEWLRTNLQAND